MGRRLAHTFEIVEYVPSACLVMRTSEGPFPMETSNSWSDVGAGATRLILRNRDEPTGFSGIMSPLMSMMLMSMIMRSANRKDLALLKKLLESDP
jgi:hypothetical protein